MDKNKELIKLFISFMFAFAIMFVVLINQRININNVEEVSVIVPATSNEIEDIPAFKSIETVETITPIEETIEHEPFEEFEATAYCACPKCCGKWADGITASGTKAVAKRTIAVDTSIIPLGTEVEIECSGENEKEDLKTLVDLIKDGLGE